MRIGRILLLAAGCSVIAGQATASGFYNMPTSLQQCLGIGFGPGYHAPLLLGPMLKTRIASQRIKRLPHGLAPPHAGGFATPSRIDFSHHAPQYQAPLHQSHVPHHGMSYGAIDSAPMVVRPTMPVTSPASTPTLMPPAAMSPRQGFENHEVIPAPRPAQ